MSKIVSKFALVASIVLALALTFCCFGCGPRIIVRDHGTVSNDGELIGTMSASDVTREPFTDIRDGKTYKTVKIGNQTWMAENLNYTTKSGSWCYNKTANCTKYGRLYNWETAVKSCPSGWHLPSNSEWEVLEESVGGKEAGRKLKTKSGWDNHGNGTDDYGFSALPGGGGYSDGRFYNVGLSGYWWSASEDISSKSAFNRQMKDFYDRDVYWQNSDKGKFYSVRCLRDD